MTTAPATVESIALLIDADNAPANKIDFIMEELASLGAVNVRKAFGNWTKPELNRWQEVLADYAIQPVHNFDLVKGKNASDMALVIEAMDILSRKLVTLFCIVSSDCDFAPLALRLRAEGKRVIGFGAKQTPEPFVKSCNRFLFLDEDERAQESREDKVTNAKKLKGDTKLMNMLRGAIRAHEGDDGWAPLSLVGSHISNQGPFDPRNYGFKQLSRMFGMIDLFEVRRSENDSLTFVRIRSRSASQPHPVATPSASQGSASGEKPLTTDSPAA